MERTLTLNIEMEDDGSATVIISEGESGCTTTEIYDKRSCDNGRFEKWLVDEVTSWITLMQDELFEGREKE